MNLITGAWLHPQQTPRHGYDWRLSYNGVMAGTTISNVQGSLVLTVAHGENKNEQLGSDFFQGTVNADVDVHDCASGPVGGRYQDCWKSYNGFVNSMLTKLSPGHLPSAVDVEDRGPLLWPSMGYVDPTTHEKVSSGLRHPSAIVWNNYLYVFYVDTSRGSEVGRQGGLEVGRVPLSDLPGRLIATPYFNGGFSPKEPSLPLGFKPSSVEQFFGKKGGRASGLWSGSDSTTKFSVAHLSGTPYFVGVEEYLNGPSHRIQLRISRDLLQWGEPVVIPGESDAHGWSDGNLHYPVLVDAKGQNTGEIDGTNFALMGTDVEGRVWHKNLAVGTTP